MRTNRWRVFPLLGWTFALWISRIRNVLTNDDLDGVAVAWRLAVAGIFLLLATVTLSWVVSGRPGWNPLKWLATWSIGFWLIRGSSILIDSDWSFGFKAVHTSLMIVTFAMVALATSTSTSTSTSDE